MPTFDIIHISQIDGKVQFFKLASRDVCEFDIFVEDCKKDANLRKQLAQMQARMEYIANLKFNYLDKTKFRELKGRKRNDPHKDFEIKTKDLRVYFFRDNMGNIIVLGGIKKTQEIDIAKMRAIKLKYFKEK